MSFKDKLRLRTDTLMAFDRAARLVADYIEQTKGEELSRLVGVLPDLREVRAQFANATTLPDDDSDSDGLETELG